MEVRLFFEFIQVAVGNRKSLSVVINDSDWQGLFDFCKKQALLGIGFTAVEKLHTVGVMCPTDIRMQWMALALRIEKKNILLNEQCKKLTEQYGHDGLATCILKGQGNCLNYPEELRNRRQCGDIDVWTTLMNGRQQGQHETTWCPKADYLREQQLSSIGQQLKENNIYPQIAQMDTDGCPQADEVGEQQLFASSSSKSKFFTHCQTKEEFIKLRKFSQIYSHIANIKKSSSSSASSREFKEIGSQADGGIAIAVQTGRNEVEYVEYHGRKAVIEYVRMQHRLEGNNEKPVIRYHHIDAPKMDGTEVEVHFRVGFVNSPLRNLRMQRWFDNHADVCMKNKTHMGFAVPTSSVNVVYQMCHLFSHFFDEGLGLRQLMDYYFVLRVWHNDVMECKDLQSQGMWSEGLGTPVMSATEVMAVLRSFGMGKFVGAVMFVLQEVFVGVNENDNENENYPQMNTDGHGCPQADEDGEQQLPAIGQQLSKKYYTPWMICEPNVKEGRKLLAEIMQGGNFGQYDTRDAALKKGGMMKHGVWKLKRVPHLILTFG